MKRVLVTGADSPLGCCLTDRLHVTPGVVKVVEFDLDGPSGRLERTAGGSPREYQSLADVLRTNEVDTVIHGSMAPDRSGATTEPKAADVVGTMMLSAALSDRTLPVRSLVLASSSAVYPVKSYKPLLHREDGATDHEESEIAASLLEAEQYARDLAADSPHLNVAVLRLGELAGPGVSGPLAALLMRAIVPAPIGFDPAVQLLHVEDAVSALVFAAAIELAGVYNVASEGTIRWSEAAEILGKRLMPVLPVEAGPLQPLLDGVGLPHVPNGMLSMLRFGLAMDTSKVEAAGFTPGFDQQSCLQRFSGR